MAYHCTDVHFIVWLKKIPSQIFKLIQMNLFFFFLQDYKVYSQTGSSVRLYSQSSALSLMSAG